MLERLEMEGVGPSPRLSFEFAPRLNLLTGDNGLGKTFVLELAWWALTRHWDEPPALRKADWHGPSFIKAGIRGNNAQISIRREVGPLAPLEFYGLPNNGLTIYARVDGGFSVWDRIRNRQRDGHSPVPFLQSYDFTPNQLWNRLEKDGRTLCNGLIQDWVAWQIKNAEPFQRLKRVLTALSPGEQEPLVPGEPTRISVDDVRDIPTLQMPYGVVPLTHASAAVKRIVGLAYLLVWAWEEHERAAALRHERVTDHIVLLVDELEAHLHPRWQRLILPSLLEVVRALREDVKVQVIAVTHSPLVLASVEPLFDEAQDALFMFDLVGQEVQATKAEWRPRGDANAWLTSEVFDLKEPRSVEAEQAITAAKAALKDPNLPIEEVRRIHNELYRVLRDTDPFWPRWLARAEAAGIEP
ncbi:ATP-binding protein [Corallococcus interemptor]|uniref:ATP-binding protein n=1 Tax=Corallococcus interemptor TaxID=2316720 RepID=A0A3A8QWA5_9BACT|nr:ATP-binding protein [Corallococcus interemptor]RKH72847.1 ATP-binding protein [Corallococcus interemptor]